MKQVFEEVVMTRLPGQVKPHHESYRDLIEKEKEKDCFTYCIIEVRDRVRAGLERYLAEENCLLLPNA